MKTAFLACVATTLFLWTGALHAEHGLLDGTDLGDTRYYTDPSSPTKPWNYANACAAGRGLGGGGGLANGPSLGTGGANGDPQAAIRGMNLVATTCTKCHGPGLKEPAFTSAAQIQDAISRVTSGDMPKGNNTLTDQDRADIVVYLNSQLATAQ